MKFHLVIIAIICVPGATARAAAFEPGSPRAVVEQLSQAIAVGDGAGIRAALYAQTPEEKKMVEGTVAMSEAIARLRPVVEKRYGEVPARAVTGDPEASRADQHAKLEGAYQQVEGEIARLTFADPAVDMVVLRKVDGRWRVPVAEKVKGQSPAEVGQRADDLMTAAKVVDEVREICAGGKWQTPNDVTIALQERMLKAQQSKLPATGPTTSPTTGPASAPATRGTASGPVR